ncbi:MAG: hypothetical protein QOJ38_1302 [Solirubrobacterales bacterium]|jgi:RNA polymerase sigma-70 factor (ECF subfamily)|nr:hypothetical protein [Solirubrobacterales bacterium]
MAEPARLSANGREPRSERQLVARFQAGDQSAFEEIYRDHLARIFFYACNVLGNDDDAADATQATMVKALDALAHFKHESEGHLSAWLLAIARNEVIDRLRAARHAPDLFVEDPRIDSGAPDESLDLIEGWLSDPALAECFERLPLDQRQVVVLHCVFRLSIGETAAVLGLPYERVKGRSRRAMVVLRRAAGLPGSMVDLKVRREPTRSRYKPARVIVSRRFSLPTVASRWQGRR